MKQCEIKDCREQAIGEILLYVTLKEPWYIDVCKKHLKARQNISPNGKPFIEGYPQWKTK